MCTYSKPALTAATNHYPQCILPSLAIGGDGGKGTVAWHTTERCSTT